MTGRFGGRQIGRSGPRIGLPVDHDRRSGAAGPSARLHASGAARPPGPPAGYPAGPQMRGAQGRDGWAPDPALGEDVRGSGRSGERLSIATLFEHMEPRPKAYRPDAHRDAPRIAHNAGRAARSATTAAMAVGGLLSVLIVFVAGFLSAILIFGEPDPNGDLAIPVGPAQPPAASDIASVPAPSPAPAPVPAAPAVQGEARQPVPEPAPAVPRSGSAGDALVPPASASLEAEPAAPSEEIAAAEAARDKALRQPLAAPVRTEGFYPPAKPQAALGSAPGGDSGIAPPASSRLGPPGGSYSLQFGAFRDRQNADVLVRELAGIAQAGVQAQPGATGETLFYVRAGAFETRAEALKAVRSLRQDAGYVTFVHANVAPG